MSTKAERAKRALVVDMIARPLTPDELIHLRNCAGLTQETAAFCFNVTPLTWNRWENSNGKSNMPPSYLRPGLILLAQHTERKP